MKKNYFHQLIESLVYRRYPLKTRHLDAESPKYSTKIFDALMHSNGLITKYSAFRVFGTDGDQIIPSISHWNNSAWKRDYGRAAEHLCFFAEDIFGNQYSLRSHNGDESLVRFLCEGGAVELVTGGVDQLLDAFVSPESSTLIDWPLLDAAFQRGLSVNPNQHLAFELPLIVGGSYSVENLTVEDANLHLGILSQLSTQAYKFPNGTRIARFSDE